MSGSSPPRPTGASRVIDTVPELGVLVADELDADLAVARHARERAALEERQIERIRVALEPARCVEKAGLDLDVLVERPPPVEVRDADLQVLRLELEPKPGAVRELGVERDARAPDRRDPSCRATGCCRGRSAPSAGRSRPSRNRARDAIHSRPRPGSWWVWPWWRCSSGSSPWPSSSSSASLGCSTSCIVARRLAVLAFAVASSPASASRSSSECSAAFALASAVSSLSSLSSSSSSSSSVTVGVDRRLSVPARALRARDRNHEDSGYQRHDEACSTL